MANELMSFEGLQHEEKVIETILEDIHFLFTKDERAELEKHARRSAETSAAAFRVMARAADRYGKGEAQSVFNAREAGGRYFAGLVMSLTMASMQQVVDDAVKKGSY